MPKKFAFLLCTFFLGSHLIFTLPDAMPAPPAKVVKEVVDYFYSGQNEEPILTDSLLCKRIKDLECEQVLDLNGISVGDVIHVWMQFFVPKGAVFDDIMVEYSHEGIPRYLAAHKVVGSIRYRVVDKFKMDKPGNWIITIKKGTTNLKEFKATVIKK